MKGLLATVFLLLSALPAHTRIAKIRWEPVPNAIRYEVRIQQGNEDIVKSVSEGSNPSWRGGLSPGYFVYQIRAIDRLQAAGEWTLPKLILVNPREIQPLSPGVRAQLRLTEKEGRLFLRWRQMGRRVKYLVEIRQDQLRYDRTVADRGEYEIENPNSGNYQWRVTPIITAEGSVDPIHLGEFDAISKGEPSTWQEFDVELDATYLKAKERFLAPVLVEIPDRMPVPYGNAVEVEWKGVEAAEAYEVRYSAVPKAPYRNLSSIERKLTVVTVSEPRISLPVENGKRYEVYVRALSHVDNRGLASIVSPETQTSFEIDNAASPLRPRNFLSVVSSVAPYRDTRTSPSQGYQGDIDGAGLGIEVALRYFFWTQIQTDVHAFFELQDVEGSRDVRTEQRIFVHYVWTPGGAESGWALKAGAGLARLGYTILSPVVSGTKTMTSKSHLSMVGLIPSVEVEKRLTEKLSLWTDAKVPFVVGIGGSGSQTDLHAAPFENYRITLGLRWNVGEGFNLALLLATEMRMIRFRQNGIDGEISRQSATRGGLGITYAW